MAGQAAAGETLLTENGFEKPRDTGNKKTFTRNLHIAKVIDVSFSKVKL